jgi:chemotaxis response regulator CheB
MSALDQLLWVGATERGCVITPSPAGAQTTHSTATEVVTTRAGLPVASWKAGGFVTTTGAGIRRDIIVVGASAGGVHTLQALFGLLGRAFPAVIAGGTVPTSL